MRGGAKRTAAIALAVAAVVTAGVVALTNDHSASTGAPPPTPAKPATAVVQAQAQLEALTTRYYMVIPGSSRAAT
jgi:hypothetical protein